MRLTEKKYLNILRREERFNPIYYYCDIIYIFKKRIMANIRELKKDIDYLVYEVISDCFTAMSVQPENKSDELAEVVGDAVVLRNELFSRTRLPGGKDSKKEVKDHYKKLRTDLIEGVDKLFERLSKVAKK